MKKLLLSLSVLLFSILPLAAMDYGINFQAGLTPSFVNIYTTENITFKIESEKKIGGEIGIRLMEQYQDYNPHFYFNPLIQFDANHFYIGGGAMFNNSMDSIDETSWFVRTGATFGNWSIGPGIGNIDIGLELSPTIFTDSSEEDALASIFISLFGSVINTFKLNVGFDWYLPLHNTNPIEIDE